MPPFLIYAKMSLGFTTLPNFVHVKLEMCQGKGPSIKAIGIFFYRFWYLQYFDPDLTRGISIPLGERCAIGEFLGQLSCSYVLNLMIF